ncbi:hypothetical protein Tco_1154739 [Tanacetum coccineum]
MVPDVEVSRNKPASLRLVRPAPRTLSCIRDTDKMKESTDDEKFDFANVKSASTPIETQKPLVKDEEASDVDVHLYRSMIGSLMYVTASRPDIMFSVCACSRFQVTPKTSHLTAVKRIFRYLKGKPKLGLWYPRESTFDLESYSDSDYAGANLDRKSTTGGCQFLGRRLITWQCKKQTIVATSTTEAEYVAAASCCGQVLWIQNQMLDYGFNFMNTKIYIDNESTICIVKNPVYHSKTKHIAIRHHFIRDAYEKKLIQVLKIHTNDNVADLLTKAFDVSRFQFLVVSIGMSWLDGSGDGVYLCFNVYKSFLDLRRIRESLIRVTNGTEALLILTLFILCLDKVSTDHVKSPKPIRIHFNRPITHAISSTDILNLQALISLTDDLSLRSNMAALESCPKHNMIGYLEKTEGNVEFHEVIDFLQRSYISHALTVSPVVSTTFVEQFWTSAKSKTINNARHITAKVAGKLVSISEASIRTDLLFDDADGIATLPNQAILDAIQLMEMKGFNLSTIEQQLTLSPSPSPRPSPNPSPTPNIPDSIPKHTGENLGDHSFNDTSLSGNEDAMTLQNVYDLFKSRREYQRTKTIKENNSQRRRSCKKSLYPNNGEEEWQKDGKAKENAQSEWEEKRNMDEDKETVEVGLYLMNIWKVMMIKLMLLRDLEVLKTKRKVLKEKDESTQADKNRILAEKLQEQEREQFTIEERAKFLHDTIAAQRRFNEHIISTLGSAKDERFIKKLNKKRGGLSKSEVIKEDTKEEVKDEDKDEESTRKRKLESEEESTMALELIRFIKKVLADLESKEQD